MGVALKSWPALIVPSSAPIALLLVNRFSNKLTPYVLNNILRNPPFCTYSSFIIVSLTPFINKPDSSNDWTIFIMSFVSSFKIISVVIPDPIIFLLIAASVADADAVNPNGIKTLLVNGLSTSTFFIKGKTIFSSGPKLRIS